MTTHQADNPGEAFFQRTGKAHLKTYGLLALVVLLLSLIGIYWRPLGQLSTLWPANAILLGLFLRIPGLASLPGWVAAAVGYIAADLITGNTVLMAVSLNLTNLLSVFVGLCLCRRLTESDRRLIPPRALPRLFLAMVAASIIAGFVGGGLLWQLAGLPFGTSVTDWAVSEHLAYIILLPTVLSAPALDSLHWKHHRKGLWPLLCRKIIPAVCLLTALLASVFIGGPGVVAFPVVALLACALSCGMFATSLLTLAFSLWTLLGTAFGGINILFDVTDINALLSMRLGVASIALAPIVVASVMTSRERSLAAMRHLAEHDALTGLLNRRSFHQQAGEALVELARKGRPAAVVMIDIDHFKRINDTYGHAVGDEVLSRAAGRLRHSLRNDDLCGRLGGEEFSVFIPDCTPELLEDITLRIHAAIREERLCLDGDAQECFSMSVSVGGTLNQGPEDDLESMLIRADRAMYAAKHGGRDQTRFI